MHGMHTAMQWSKRLALGMAFAAIAACGGGAPEDGNGGAVPGVGGNPSLGGGGGGGSGGSGQPLATSTYAISWNAVNDPNVTGYRLYYDVAQIGSGNTPAHVDVTGSAVNFRPGSFGIAAGATMYVAISSIGAGGAESPVSTQVSMVVD